MNEYDDVWKYFERNNDYASCNLCHKILGCKGSSTTGLHRHLVSLHSMKRKVKEEAIPGSSKKMKAMVKPSFVNKDSAILERVVSELAARDGVPIQTICKSEFIQNSIRWQGFSVPKEPSEVMRLVHRYQEIIKLEMVSKIERMKAENKKFSLSISEHSRYTNRTYFSLQIHYPHGDFDNLGLIRIANSSPGVELVDLIDSKIKLFGLDFDRDIVSITSSNDIMSPKFHKSSPVYIQQCYNEAIHSAVLDTLYERVEEDNQWKEDVMDLESEDEFASDNEREFVKEKLRINAIMKDTIDKIHKILSLFKTSQLHNMLLQSYVKSEEMLLLLDNEMHWNTIEVMIERFLLLKSPILSALRDMNLSDVWIPEQDDIAAVNILKTLKTVRMAIEALSRHDANLLTGEGVLKFLFNTLKEHNSEISIMLLYSIKEQISKRRESSLISLMRFLQDPNCTHTVEEDDFFAMSSKNKIIKTAIMLAKRLFNNIGEQNDFEHFNQKQEVDEDALSIDQDNNYTSNLEMKLEESIRQSLKPVKTVEENFFSLMDEISAYEESGKITCNLERLSHALNTIKPTSKPNDCIFSTSGKLVSKRRSHLSYKSMDCLCFLKFHFNKNASK